MENCAYAGYLPVSSIGESLIKLAQTISRSLSAILFSEAGREAKTKSGSETVNIRAVTLLDSYGNNILRLAYSYLHNMSDAEDVLQDTLIQYLKAAPRFESGEHEKAWLLRVAANISKNRIDYNRVRNADELNEALVAEQKEDLSFVWEAVKALPEKYRIVIHLFYHEGYSTAEIASILNEKESTVRSRLNRGRERLKTVLREAYDFDQEV